MTIEIREQAREDLQLGFRFYEEQAPGLGRYFLECLFADIDSLTQFAGIHESVDGFQRLLSKRFPFAIYYTVAGERGGCRPSLIAAAIHTGSNAGFGGPAMTDLYLPNGDDFKVVWSLLRREHVAKLVTTYVLGDEGFSEEG